MQYFLQIWNQNCSSSYKYALWPSIQFLYLGIPFCLGLAVLQAVSRLGQMRLTRSISLAWNGEFDVC